MVPDEKHRVWKYPINPAKNRLMCPKTILINILHPIYHILDQSCQIMMRKSPEKGAQNLISLTIGDINCIMAVMKSAEKNSNTVPSEGSKIDFFKFFLKKSIICLHYLKRHIIFTPIFIVLCLLVTGRFRSEGKHSSIKVTSFSMRS